jgi:hypothetical protein
LTGHGTVAAAVELGIRAVAAAAAAAKAEAASAVYPTRRWRQLLVQK